MKKLILALLLVSMGPVYGETVRSLVEIRSGEKLWVEHHQAKAGRPTVFLANGLTYSTRQYDALVRALRGIDPGVGVVSWDMKGMGRTLLNDLDERKHKITIENQAHDLHALVQVLNIKGPISLLGLSYGGALELVYSTLYPLDFDNIIAFAPLVERLSDQDTLLNSWVASHKLMYPLDPRNDDELYDHYLRIWIYSTYPAAEPIILENPYKLEAVFRMVQGVKNFNAFRIAGQLPTGKLHLIAAVDDEHVKIKRLDEFWQAVPAAARASYLRLNSSRHKIPEQWPEVAAVWTLQILFKNPHLQNGLVFSGDPFGGTAKSGGITVPLAPSNMRDMLAKREVNCESILRALPEPEQN